jgi:hypothetical protein
MVVVAVRKVMKWLKQMIWDCYDSKRVCEGWACSPRRTRRRVEIPFDLCGGKPYTY